MIVKIAGIGLILIIGIIALAYVKWNAAISKEIKTIINEAKDTDRVITEEMITTLPSPVQRYMRYTGVVGKRIPKTVYLEQKGRIRNDNKSPWMDFEASQYYSTREPGFVWRVFMPNKQFPVVMGRDHYLGGKGEIGIRMLSAVPVALDKGTEMDMGAAMRYLNELMWFPAAYFGNNISFTAIDEKSAQVVFTDRGKNYTATVYYDSEGRLINFVGERYMRTKTGPQMALWETPVAKYREMEDLKLPTSGEGVYKLKDGDMKYIELSVTKLEYSY